MLGYVQALFRDNRGPEAEATALSFIGTNPGFSPVYDVLSQQYQDAGRTDDQLKILNRWADADPNDATPVLKLAGYYANLGKQAEMKAALQRITDHSEKFPQAWMRLGDFYLGLGDQEAAKTQFGRGVKADPANATAYRNRIVTVLLSQGKRPEAIAMLDEIIAAAPTDPEPRLARARLWMETGKLKQAVSELQTLVKDHPQDPLVQYEAGRANQLNGDAASARANFVRAAQLRGEFIEPRVQLAQMAADRQDAAGELIYAQEILRISPDNPAGRLLNATGLMGTGRLPEAGRELRLLLRDYPESRDVQIQTALLAVYEKRLPDAEKIFAALAQSKSDDVRPVLGLATVYSARNQYDRALRILGDEAKKTPNSLPVQNALILAAMTAGQTPEP